MKDSTLILAGAVGGALVSGVFIFLEVRKLQSPEFARSAEQRVAASAERAVMRHLGEVYGLDAARIASITAFAQGLPR